MADEPLESRVNRLERAVKQLCKENAELRHFLAALVIAVSDGFDTEYVPSYSALVDWAFEEFDPEILAECLADYVHDAADEESNAAAITGQSAIPAETQHSLFAPEEDDEQTTA